MRLVTPLIALAIAIGAVVLPGGVGLTGTGSIQSVDAAIAADSPKPIITFAPLNSGTLAPGAVLTLTGTISNSTASPIAAGTATVYLDRSAVASRTALANWLAPTSTSASDKLGTAVLSAPTPEVAAGRTVAVQLQVPAAAIDFGTQAGTWAVHTLAVRVMADDVEVGQARSSIVWNPGETPTRTGLAMAFPLTVPRSSDGLIPSDLLATYTSPGGLLTRQLDAVVGQNIAIGIDPRILASINILGTSTPPSALAWLDRLESAPNETFALSYGDSDLAVASQAKSTRVLTPTSFPVDTRLFPGASSPSPSPSVTSTGAPDNNPTIPLPTTESLQAFKYTLDAVAWPAADSVVEADLDNFSTSGLTTTILNSNNVGYGDLGYTPESAALIGTHKALVADASISKYLQDAASATSDLDFQTAMTSLSSSLAVVGREKANDSRLLLATFSRTDPGSDFRLSATIAALATLPWVGTAPISETTADFAAGSATPPVTATVTARAEPAERVAQVAGLLASEATAGAFSSILVDPTNITGERRLSLLSLLSNDWTPDSTWKSEVAKYAKATTKLTGSVSIARSSSVLITATNSPLPVTVTNELAWPVTVYVTVRSPTNIVTITNDRVELAVEAQSQAKVSVPVKSNANGNVTLAVSLSSATNVPISTIESIDVDVQAGWETAFTAVVAALVFGVFGFGIYRNIAKRRKAKRAPDDAGPDDSNASGSDAAGTNSADPPLEPSASSQASP